MYIEVGNVNIPDSNMIIEVGNVDECLRCRIISLQNFAAYFTSLINYTLDINCRSGVLYFRPRILY